MARLASWKSIFTSRPATLAPPVSQPPPIPFAEPARLTPEQILATELRPRPDEEDPPAPSKVARFDAYSLAFFGVITAAVRIRQSLRRNRRAWD